MCLSTNEAARLYATKERVMEFVETICIEQGQALNLERHNARMNRTRRIFWGDSVEDICLEDWIRPTNYEHRTRCRVVYARDVVKVAYFEYHRRPVQSLHLVTCDEADYTFKSVDRSLLDWLYANRGDADDALAVRQGLLTDTSIANIALLDGTHWYTPLHPLLKGTRRQALLDVGLLEERDIRADEIYQYSKIRLFNAMIPFGMIEFDTSAVR